VVNPDHPGKLKISNKAYDRKVAGIVSGAGGVNIGKMTGQGSTVAHGAYPVTLTGRVYHKADTVNGPSNQEIC
jgi:hypothetical protein